MKITPESYLISSQRRISFPLLLFSAYDFLVPLCLLHQAQALKPLIQRSSTETVFCFNTRTVKTDVPVVGTVHDHCSRFSGFSSFRR